MHLSLFTPNKRVAELPPGSPQWIKEQQDYPRGLPQWIKEQQDYPRDYPSEFENFRSNSLLMGHRFVSDMVARSQLAPSSIPMSGTFFRGDLVKKKNFYSRSPSSADSRRAVVSYWRKNVH